MFWIVLLSFSSSLACGRTKCVFLNDVPCMVTNTFNDLNPVALKHYPFKVSLDKST